MTQNKNNAIGIRSNKPANWVVTVITAIGPVMRKPTPEKPEIEERICCGVFLYVCQKITQASTVNKEIIETRSICIELVIVNTVPLVFTGKNSTKPPRIPIRITNTEPTLEYLFLCSRYSPIPKKTTRPL
jgi:hypothetical protein